MPQKKEEKVVTRYCRQYPNCGNCEYKPKEEILTVDPPKRVDAPRSVEEILQEKADWHCKHCTRVFVSYKEAKEHERIGEDAHHISGVINILDVLEVVKAQRAQLKKLIEDYEKRRKDLVKRLEFERTHKKVIPCDELVLQAGIGLIDEVLERLERLK